MEDMQSQVFPLSLHPDRLLPVDPSVRDIARRLYKRVRDLAIISPHGHVDPRIPLDNAAFRDPAQLFVTPDHYVTRLLHASGVPLESLGVGQGPLSEANAAYCAALTERFSNPRMCHRLDQIAWDGSQKLPIRVLPILRKERAAGRLPAGVTRPVAAWVCHLRGSGAAVLAQARELGQS